MATLKLQLNRDDLLSDTAYTDPSFSETAVGDGWKVVFSDEGSPVPNGTVNFAPALEDAYARIRQNLVDTSNGPIAFRLTNTRINALTDVLPGQILYNTTNDNVVCRNNTEFVVIGGTEWQIRPSTTIQTDQSSTTTIDSFTLDDEETYMVQINVVGTKSNGSDRCGVIKQAVVYRDGGIAVLQGNVSVTLEEYSDSNWDVLIEVSGNDVRARVKGVALTVIDWKCSMQFIEQ